MQARRRTIRFSPPVAIARLGLIVLALAVVFDIGAYGASQVTDTQRPDDSQQSPEVSASPTQGDTAVNRGADSPVLDSLRAEELRRAQLANAKLELEIERLRSDRWWKQHLTALITSLGLVVTLILAWNTGLFDARNLFLRAETARLEADKKRLDDDRRIEPIRPLIELIKVTPGAATPAVDSLVPYLEGLGPAVPGAYLLVDSAARMESGTPAAGVLWYALYHGTKDAAWLRRLFDWTDSAVPSFGAEAQMVCLDIFAQARWSNDERAQVSLFLIRLARTNRNGVTDALAINTLGRLHQGSWERLAWDSFRLYDVDPSAYFDAVVIGRDAFLGASGSYRALAREGMGLLAPPAYAVMVVANIDRQADGLEAERAGRQASPATASLVNRAVASWISRVPLPARGEERYDDMSVSHWLNWRESNREVFDLWMEPTLATLRSEPQRFKNMLHIYDDPYG